MNEILAILLSERPLFITSEGYRQMVMAVLPYMKPSDAAEQPKVKSFFLDPPTYKEETDKAVAKLQKLIKATNSTKAIQITNDFENQEPPADRAGISPASNWNRTCWPPRATRRSAPTCCMSTAAAARPGTWTACRRRCGR